MHRFTIIVASGTHDPETSFAGKIGNGHVDREAAIGII